MSVKFPSATSAYYDNADFLDNCSQFAFACLVKLDTLSAGNKQYIWSHYGSVNRISLRKDNGSPEYWRFAVKAGGVAITIDDTTGAVAQDVVYFISGQWRANNADGLRIYRNGVRVGGDVSTTTQTANYDSGGSIDLYLAARVYNSDHGLCSLENMIIWVGEWFDDQVHEDLYYGVWPHQIGAAGQPTVQYEGNGDVLSRIRDLSGNRRHITLFNGTPQDGGWLGRYEDPSESFAGGGMLALDAGAPSENPWTLAGSVNHPTTQLVVSGLTNGQEYDFYVTAVDISLNESVASAEVSETCEAVAASPHVPRFRLGGV